jgi:hypothetical protein
MTRLGKYSTSAINATDGGALTMATKAKGVLGAGKESSNVRPYSFQKGGVRKTASALNMGEGLPFKNKIVALRSG